MNFRQRFESTIEAIRREGRYRVFTDLISLIAIEGPWITAAFATALAHARPEAKAPERRANREQKPCPTTTNR